MKIERVKKRIWFLVIAVIGFTSCNKQDSKNERMNVVNDPLPGIHPRSPRVPRIPLPISRCIYFYQDIIDVLGASRVIVRKVVLASGAIIEPGNDLSYISYEAIASNQANSIFDSKLTVEWRWPGGNWQLSTADVWSLGCVYQQAGQPPYTNLLKGNDTILINTCFYWSTSEHTGERVDYLIVE